MRKPPPKKRKWKKPRRAAVKGVTSAEQTSWPADIHSKLSFMCPPSHPPPRSGRKRWGFNTPPTAGWDFLRQAVYWHPYPCRGGGRGVGLILSHRGDVYPWPRREHRNWFGGSEKWGSGSNASKWTRVSTPLQASFYHSPPLIWPHLRFS